MDKIDPLLSCFLFPFIAFTLYLVYIFFTKTSQSFLHLGLCFVFLLVIFLIVQFFNPNRTPYIPSAYQSQNINTVRQFHHTDSPTSGYVYLAYYDSIMFKIGRTKDVHRRIKELNTTGTKLPYKIHPIHIIPTNNMYTLERLLHQKFASRRGNGEYFRLSQSDIDYIKSIKYY